VPDAGCVRGVSQSRRRFTKERVSLKVPPYLVHVKYKTTTSSGAEVDTPGTRPQGPSTSDFLGFLCGKLREAALLVGFVNAR
jgi:hypothetical protein